jgi:hypothetical protein
MTLVRQFQLHESEMRNMLQSMMSKEREKEEYIRKLEQENARLRNSTF